MINFELNSNDDVIDVRDVIERYEELEDEKESLEADVVDASSPDDLEQAETALEEWKADNGAEFTALKDLLEELAGNGGDEQWRGDWYPVTLIRYSYFESYMDEMLEDCGELPKDLPCYLSITVDYDALKMDYSTVEIDGIDYYYR